LWAYQDVWELASSLTVEGRDVGVGEFQGEFRGDERGNVPPLTRTSSPIWRWGLYTVALYAFTRNAGLGKIKGSAWSNITSRAHHLMFHPFSLFSVRLPGLRRNRQAESWGMESSIVVILAGFADYTRCTSPYHPHNRSLSFVTIVFALRPVDRAPLTRASYQALAVRSSTQSVLACHTQS
jgi:hypothetical protein